MNPFPADPVLTGIALAYPQKRLVADLVLRRLLPLMQDEYKYYEWTREETFTVPDTRVGRKSEPKQVEFTAIEKTGATKDYGLDDLIPAKDMGNAPGGIDPRFRATSGLTSLILLDREVRAANLVFDAAQYAAGNKVTLAGANQWSDPTSTPIDDIMTGLDAAFVRPNKMCLGREVWTKLSQHPDIVTATSSATKAAGLVKQQLVAELFELEELIVGEARVNNAKKGQTPSYVRTWGKHALLFWDDPDVQSTVDERVTFGWTAQNGTRFSGSIPEPKKGLRGGELVRVGESVEERIVAPDVAYFIENAVA
jgi:hypothetical protein